MCGCAVDAGDGPLSEVCEARMGLGFGGGEFGDASQGLN